DGAGVRHLTLACSSASDQFPVYVSQKDSVKSYLAKDSKSYRFIVTDESTPRIDLVTLKGRNAESQILVLHPERAPEAPQAKAGVDPGKVRANDLLAAGMAGESAQNAVFIARVHLRNLDLPKIRELIMERPLASEEVMFIRTFLQIMIKNEHNKPELVGVKGELQKLDEICRLASLVESTDRTLFDIELDKGVAPSIAKDMAKFVAAKRGRATSKDDEILFWEWEYRLNKMAGIAAAQ
ncbi:MAG: hypothetical protein HY042_06365, partial [Spirochaetia bacterium]|nr:hypothetical protein [Spirochaetia bacterium]